MKSIRGSTMRLVLLAIAASLLLGGITLYAVVRSALFAHLDDTLAARIGGLAAATNATPAGFELELSGEALPRFKPGPEAEYFILWQRLTPGGPWQAVESSESFDLGPSSHHAGHPNASTDQAAMPPGWRDQANEHPLDQAFDSPLPDARPGRWLIQTFGLVHPNTAITTPATPSLPSSTNRIADGPDEPELAPVPADWAGAPAARVAVGTATSPVDRTLLSVAGAIAGTGALTLLVASVAALLAVSLGTRPLGALSARVGAIGPGNLSGRLPTDALPSELVPITEQLNELLTRLQTAMERERRFAGAASHELRTPISELRLLLEVTLAQPRSDAQWRTTAATALTSLDRASALVDVLLRTARDEHTVTLASGPTEPCDLPAILADEASRAIALTGMPPSHLTIDPTTRAGALPFADDAAGALNAHAPPAAIRIITANLLTNALRHGDNSRDHPAHCSLHREPDALVLRVTNKAPHLHPGDEERMFEPFWRGDSHASGPGASGICTDEPADPARTKPSGTPSFGLGLGIARFIAESLGGRCSAKLEAGTLCVEVRLPPQGTGGPTGVPLRAH